MKNIAWVGIALFFVLAGSAFAGDLPEKSIYHFKQEWLNQNGKKKQLESLRGQTRVLAMIYTHCNGACPLIVNAMKKIEKQLPPSVAQKTGFVLFSMDPKRDSPKKLKSFAKAHRLDKKRWQLYTSNESHVQELATALDFNFKAAPNGMFLHQNTIFILDPDGVVVHQYPNLDEAVSGTVKALTQISG